MAVKSYRDLNVWQRAVDLADQVYELTEKFPNKETYGLISQLRRAAVSVSSNIAEGSARNTTGELVQFLGIAKGSLAELETQLIISLKRKFLTEEEFNIIMRISDEVSKMLYKLQQNLLVTSH